MSKNQETPKIPLPRGWKKQVRSAVLHVLSLAQYAAVYPRRWAADRRNARVRLKAELDRANQELLLLREEIRIKDARLARIDPVLSKNSSHDENQPSTDFERQRS